MISHLKFILNDLLLEIILVVCFHLVDLPSDTHSSSKASIHLSFKLQSLSMILLFLLSDTFLQLHPLDRILSLLPHQFVHLMFSPSLLCISLRLLNLPLVVQVPHSLLIFFNKLLRSSLFILQFLQPVLHLEQLHVTYFLFHLSSEHLLPIDVNFKSLLALI